MNARHLRLALLGVRRPKSGQACGSHAAGCDILITPHAGTQSEDPQSHTTCPDTGVNALDLPDFSTSTVFVLKRPGDASSSRWQGVGRSFQVNLPNPGHQVHHPESITYTPQADANWRHHHQSRLDPRIVL